VTRYLPQTLLSSTRNPRIQAAAALRDRRAREETGLTLVDGARELSRALAAGVRVVEVFVDPAKVGAAGAQIVVDNARAQGAAIVPVAPSVLDHLAYGDRAEGLVATVAVPDLSPSALVLPEDPLVVVLEGVEKPGNLGAVLRTADGAGANAVLASDPRTDLFNPNAIRASMGTIFAMPLASGPGPEIRARLDAGGIRLVAARVDGAVPYMDLDLRGPLAIVLGSEADGLTDAWSGAEVIAVRLPMLGAADSLNVSIAAAVLLYEARRQRGLPARR